MNGWVCCRFACSGPFPADDLLAVLPSSVKSLAILDRTKEIGANGEPLYQEIMTLLMEAYTQGTISNLPRVIGGRYGLSSKEFTPAMAKAVFDELAKAAPKNHFTIGITDDVTHTSLEFDPKFNIEGEDVTRALFFGLGSRWYGWRQQKQHQDHRREHRAVRP